MGTSQSSSGPGAGVPLLPPWTPDPPPPLDPQPEDPPNERPDPPATPSPAASSPGLAPPRRWSSSRTEFGRWARTGDSISLRRGLRHYTAGHGGSSTATARFAGTSHAAGRLADVLRNPPTDLRRLSETTQDADDVIRAVVMTAVPTDGTQDAESNAAAASDALADLLTAYPDSTLTALAPNEIDALVEFFVARDVCRRIDLDVGESIRQKSPDLRTAALRLSSLHEFVREVVYSSFREVRVKAEQLDERRIAVITHAAIAETFRVFEEDVR